jgi:hypothetical protein
MYLVRDVFQVKFGHMDKVLAGIKAASEANPGRAGTTRVLTDASGSMFTLVFESKIESIDGHREAMMVAFEDPEMAQSMAEIGQYFESGRREYYNIEYEAES